MDKYKFTDKMHQISGFGGGYEDVCRQMVIKGVEWLEKHPKANLSVKTYKNVYGLTDAQSQDAKDLEKAFLEGNDDVTGAMVQAVWGHLYFIKKNGWNKYIKEMEKPKDSK